MKPRNACQLSVILVAACSPSLVATVAASDWPQWGGPNRDFSTEGAPLSVTWPPDGPPRLWERDLGVGYSGIVVAGEELYTMYRDTITAPVEYVVALKAKTGATLWRNENAAPLPGPPAEPPDQRWGGQGPNATPLIVGDRLYTIGSNALLHCLDRHTGKLLWKRDLAADFGACTRDREESTGGFCISPVGYKNTLIIPIGRKGSDESGESRSILALDQRDGSVVWKAQRFRVGAASPLVVSVAGQDQLVVLVKEAIVGLNPLDGAQLWRQPLPDNEWPVVSPVWAAGDRLLVRDRNNTRVFALPSRDGVTTPEEVWSSRKLRFGIATPVPLGDYVYGASDQMMIAVNAKTGKRTWVKRGFPSAAVVAAGDKLIILDENGRLTLATPTPDDLTVHAQAQVTERYSLTAPVLVGTTLYIRDRKKILALDLAAPSSVSTTAMPKSSTMLQE